MTHEEILILAKKIQSLSYSTNRETLIKIGTLKGRVDEMFERSQKEKINKS